MKPHHLRHLLFTTCLLGGTFTAHAQTRAAPDYVAIAKRTSLRSLDSTAADVALERWFTDIAHIPASKITWEVNDCGEGGDGNKAPTCVEAQVKLRGDSVASISVTVTGFDGKREPPQLWWLLVGAGTQLTSVKPLSAWMSAVVGQRPPFRE